MTPEETIADLRKQLQSAIALADALAMPDLADRYVQTCHHASGMGEKIKELTYERDWWKKAALEPNATIQEMVAEREAWQREKSSLQHDCRVCEGQHNSMWTALEKIRKVLDCPQEAMVTKAKFLTEMATIAQDAIRERDALRKNGTP